MALRMYVLGEPAPSEFGAEAADANCYGRLSLSDAILILRNYVLGTPFPC